MKMLSTIAVCSLLATTTASASPSNATAVNALQKNGWVVEVGPNGTARSLVRPKKQPVYPPIVNQNPPVPTPKPPRITSSRAIYLEPYPIQDPYISASLGEKVLLSGEAYFKRVAGMPKGLNAPGASAGAGSPSDYIVRYLGKLSSPNGGTFLLPAQEHPVATESCISPNFDLPAEQQCLFVRQHYDLEYSVPISMPEGQWDFSVLIEVIRKNSGAKELSLYSGEIAGDFVVDNTKPMLELTAPLPNSDISYPVGVIDLTFEFWDPGIFPSGIASFTFSGFAADRPFNLFNLNSNSATVSVDLTGLEGQITVSAQVSDVAGNSTVREWTLNIVRPDAAYEVATQFIEANAELLGISNTSTISFAEKTSGETDAYNIKIDILTFQQVGPGGLPLWGRGIVVDIANDSEVVAVNSSYASELDEQPNPVFNVSNQQAASIAISQAVSTSVENEPIISAIWFASKESDATMETFKPIYLAQFVDGEVVRQVTIDITNGEVLGNFVLMFPDLYTFTGNSPLGGSIHQELLTQEFSWYECQQGATVNNVCLKTSLIAPKGTSSDIGEIVFYLATVAPAFGAPGDKSYAFANIMFWNSYLSGSVNTVRSGWSQAWEADTYIRGEGTPEYAGCNATNSIACTIPTAVGTTGISDILYVYQGNSVCGWLPGGCGEDPQVIIHETAHGILLSKQIFPIVAGVIVDALSGLTPGGYVGAFHEGLAQANECVAIEGCWDWSPSNFGTMSKWNVTTEDSHKAGAPLTTALAELQQRLQVYPTSQLKAGLKFIWGIAARMNKGSTSLHLGDLATAAKAAAAEVGLSTVNTRMFYSEILYAFTRAGLPIGNHVSSLPSAPTATIAWRPDSQSVHLGQLLSPTTRAFPIDVVGTRFSTGITAYRLHFYLTDPSLPGAAVNCGSTVTLQTAALPQENPKYGKASFTKEQVGAQINDCHSAAYFFFKYRDCAPMKIFITAEMYWAPGFLQPSTFQVSSMNRTDIIGAYSPYFTYQGTKDCSCTDSCDGCTTTSVSNAKDSDWFYPVLGLFGILWIRSRFGRRQA